MDKFQSVDRYFIDKIDKFYIIIKLVANLWLTPSLLFKRFCGLRLNDRIKLNHGSLKIIERVFVLFLCIIHLFFYSHYYQKPQSNYEKKVVWLMKNWNRFLCVRECSLSSLAATILFTLTNSLNINFCWFANFTTLLLYYCVYMMP